jgi:short-subunit dehydrogenase
MKNAVITGASSGIGEATARFLSGKGYRPLLVARREDRLRELAGEVGGSYLAVDLVAPDAPEQVRGRVREEFGGRLDLLVNNAGASWRARFGDEEKGGYENVRKTMEINFDAVLRLTEALLPILRASAPSSIVNVASVAGRVARPRAGAYSASKFALAGWSEALHFEEREHGVHVGAV